MLAIILMAVGLLGTGYSFWSAPKTLEQAKEILAKQDAHHGGHEAVATHTEEAHHAEEAKVEEHVEEVVTEETQADSTATQAEEHVVNVAEQAQDSTNVQANEAEVKEEVAHTEAKEETHAVA